MLHCDFTGTSELGYNEPRVRRGKLTAACILYYCKCTLAVAFLTSPGRFRFALPSCVLSLKKRSFLSHIII